MMSHAYAIEGMQALLALVTLVLTLWTHHGVLLDQYAARSGSAEVVRLALWKVRVSGWHLAIVTVMMAGAGWVVLEAPPEQHGFFWHREQLTPGRIVMTAFITAHLCAAITQRVLVWKTRGE